MDERPARREEDGRGAPGFVLVHGGYHGAWCWDRVTPLLDGPALAVDLPGRGSHPQSLDDVTIESSADSVVTDIDDRGFSRVILVGHSLAGVTLPALAERLGSRVVQAVFVSCLVVPDGMSWVQTVAPDGRDHVEGLRTGPGSRSELSAERHRSLLFNDMDVDDWRFIEGNVCADSMHFYTDRVSWGTRLGSLPRAYVRLLRDRAVSPSDQDEMIRRLGPGAEVRDIDASHEVMVTQPSALAATLNELAGPYLAKT